MKKFILRARNFLSAHQPLAALIAAFILLATIYSIVTPIFEAGDEVWHYPVVQSIARGNGLPIQDPAIKTLWAQEGGQPPLYYALSALATFWIDTRDLEERRWINPHAQIGIPLLFGNKNLVVHTSAENFPWQGTTLAVHLIRFLSIIFSAITIALTYLLALEIGNGFVIAGQAKESPSGEGDCFVAKNASRNDRFLAATAAGFVAFNPMFVFISASVNNDSLATMLATVSLLALTRLITRPVSRARFIFLGVALGLAVLTKVSNLGLLIVAGIVFTMSLREAFVAVASDLCVAKQSPKSNSEIASPPMAVRNDAIHGDTASPRLLVSAFVAAALVIVIAFWWYARNWILYGDPLAFNVWLAIAGARPQPFALTDLLKEFQGLRISFWGNFGGVNLIAPEWVYIALDVFTVIAIIGLCIGVARKNLPRLLALPALHFAIVFGALMRWTSLTLASQGRLMFPAIAAIAVLFAFGLAQVQSFTASKIYSSTIHRPSSIVHRPPSILIPHLSFVIFLFLFLFTALAPFTLIAPAYALPARLLDATPSNLTRITFENKIELIGYDLPQKSIAPGNELPLTFYWRGSTRLTEDFSIYIHIFDAHGKKVGQWDAFPGNGLYPTRLWQAGEIIVDHYRVPLALDARAPQAARVEVGLYRKATLQNLIARDPQARVITPTIARIKIAGEARVQIENPLAVSFGDAIVLAGYSLPQSIGAGTRLELKLFWRARAVSAEDYTVFVHLVDANGNLIAQKDSEPQNGAYPTSLWDAGEIIADAYEIAIPRDAPTELQVRVGLYRAADGSRVNTRAGDSVLVGTVRVTR